MTEIVILQSHKDLSKIAQHFFKSWLLFSYQNPPQTPIHYSKYLEAAQVYLREKHGGKRFVITKRNFSETMDSLSVSATVRRTGIWDKKPAFYVSVSLPYDAPYQKKVIVASFHSAEPFALAQGELENIITLVHKG